MEGDGRGWKGVGVGWGGPARGLIWNHRAVSSLWANQFRHDTTDGGMATLHRRHHCRRGTRLPFSRGRKRFGSVEAASVDVNPSSNWVNWLFIYLWSLSAEGSFGRFPPCGSALPGRQVELGSTGSSESLFVVECVITAITCCARCRTSLKKKRKKENTTKMLFVAPPIIRKWIQWIAPVMIIQWAANSGWERQRKIDK